MCFVISLLFLHRLRFETFSLIDRIRKLGKGVSVFLAHNEDFKTVRKARIFFIFACQWRNRQRVAIDECRLNQCIFHKRLEKFIDDMPYRHVLSERHIVFFRQSLRFCIRHRCPEIDACNGFDCVNHVDARVWAGQVDFGAVIDYC